MLVVAILFDILGAGAGLYAALLWYRASIVPVLPSWGTGCEPGDAESSSAGWIGGQLQAGLMSSGLNAKAAKWTAAAVGLGALGNLAGIF